MPPRLVAILPLFAVSLMAQDLPKGAIIDTVACRHALAQSYALYLPSHYAGNRIWPILYCFDPAARGRIPVERFAEAAEKYGWIVAGSNNSRNGPMEASFAAAEAMWKDTQARFRFDPKRIYATGFSGGARVAFTIALSSGQLAGVIAVGGGFPGGKAPKSVPFAVFGLAGVDDFNYTELRRLDRDLAALGVPHRFAVFDGGHAWMPAASAVEAVEWMELLAMQSGRRSKDEALIDALLEKRLAKARAAGETAEAFLAYTALAADFSGLRPTEQFDAAAARLTGTKAVKQYEPGERDQEVRQQRLTSELLELSAGLRAGDPEMKSMLAIRRTVASLREAGDAKQDSPKRRVARRVLGGFFVGSIEEARHHREQKDYQRAWQLLELAALANPDAPMVLYEQACTDALGGKRKAAVEALAKLLEKGAVNPVRLEAEACFAPLLKDPAIEKLKAR